jgi:hypothetical protein
MVKKALIVLFVIMFFLISSNLSVINSAFHCLLCFIDSRISSFRLIYSKDVNEF